MSSLIFHKMLKGKLNIGNGAEPGSGAPRRAESIVNLVGTDVVGIKEQCMVIGMLAWALVGGVGGVVMIFITVGPAPGLAGLAVNGAFITASSLLSKSLKTVEQRRTAASDARMQALAQVITIWAIAV